MWSKKETFERGVNCRGESHKWGTSLLLSLRTVSTRLKTTAATLSLISRALVFVVVIIILHKMSGHGKLRPLRNKSHIHQCPPNLLIIRKCRNVQKRLIGVKFPSSSKYYVPKFWNKNICHMQRSDYYKKP